ncbi:hypothetical protein SY88_12500 [Clostridiales bacterium PH28_bin88]|nr:hypothetical protein SY88_12500 [Clostridiales bacterium PH28_bin88]
MVLAEEPAPRAPEASAAQAVAPAKPTEAKAENRNPWENLGEMQMALMIINKQFEYLMSRVEDGDERVKKLSDSYEERLQKEVDKVNALTSSFEEKLAQKDAELQSARKEISWLQQQAALFNSKSGVYLKILIGFLAGTLFGLIMSSFLHWWKGRAVQKGLTAKG